MKDLRDLNDLTIRDVKPISDRVQVVVDVRADLSTVMSVLSDIERCAPPPGKFKFFCFIFLCKFMCLLNSDLLTNFDGDVRAV